MRRIVALALAWALLAVPVYAETVSAPAISLPVSVANGGTGVSVQPAFAAYGSANQSISSGVATKVTLDTELFDTNNNFASNRFTATVAGYYQINATVRGQDTVALTQMYIAFYKTGAEYYRGASFGVFNNTGAATLQISTVIYLNGSSDYVELFGFLVGTSPSFNFSSAAVTSSMSGSFLHQ